MTITGQHFKNGQSAPEMFSPAVDKAWNEQLGTPAYEALCLETVGQPIRHVANNGHGPIAWVTASGAVHPTEVAQVLQKPLGWLIDGSGLARNVAPDPYQPAVGRVVGKPQGQHPSDLA
ncbi:hypothetical protein [Streptomyces brevispora]|uniref:Uncharacterized protein n=1 Tax=Streptomyces brevispora TaxID=887462 RepID=A0A561TYM4_9ACTN|nr:hypothetical protein [Streptomyces brevispora]TWF92219.1 hypothetical protein FHX80_12539 [Streptomyces brevispora]WSC11487.1 hypothetical protein OIE64_00370 [Streptomyces brevispora]WSC17624.1 hypothetical protein OIE64_35670 [Streptomyces brevispora]